jgi:tetratricopeptide (TPR) repeat protein
MSSVSQRELESAVAAALKTPDNDDAWDKAESLAASLERPDDVADAYRDALDTELPAGLALHIGERASQYLDEWFGEDPERLSDVLGRVLEIDPRSQWAFQKLTVALTVAGRWDQLLKLYDNTIFATEKADRKVRLLNEAYESARDLADRPDKAIEYLAALYEIEPTDKRADALERLLERNERWVELIALWEERLGKLEGAPRKKSQMQIARTWLTRLDKAREALTSLARVFDESDDPGDDALALLEEILTATTASTRVRAQALDILRHRYEAAEKPLEVVRVLELAIPLVGTTKRRALHREAGERLSVLGDNKAALEHYAQLLALEPQSAATQRAMHAEAAACGDYQRYAEGVAAAAEVASDADRIVALLDDAAQTRLDFLSDATGAIELLARALAVRGLSPANVLTVGRKLNQLLAGADRSVERLEVLEKMAAAESVPSSRRALIGDLARLAEKLGEADRALEAWARRRADDADDLEALEATIAILEGERRFEPLIEALEQRVRRSSRPSERRADLTRIATVQADELDRKEAALAVWRRIHDEFGEDPEIIAALSSLLAATGKWDEHTALLERTSTEQTRGLADRLGELGQTYLGQLDMPEAALRCFRRAVGVEPNHAAARAGLAALLEIAEWRPAAAEALSRALRDTEDWAGFLALTEPRLHGAATGEQRRAILVEAAEIHLQHTGDKAMALDHLARAFPLGPGDRALEDKLVALAGEVAGADNDAWQTALESYRGAIGATAGDPGAEIGLRLRAAALVETRLGDADTALSTYLSCCRLQPDRRQAVAAAVRLGVDTGRVAEAASALVAYTARTEQLDSGLLAELGRDNGAGIVSAAHALAGAAGTIDLPDRIGAELYWQVSGWLRTGEAGDDAIAAAVERVVALDPGRAEGWRSLVELRRPKSDIDGGRPLFDALTRLSELEPNDIDVVAEAADVACERLVGPADRELRETAVTNLYARASSAWKGSIRVTGERDPVSLTQWAIERLVDEYRGAGTPQRCLDLLIESARLPWDTAQSRAMRLQAAEIATRDLEDRNAAAEILAQVLHREPRDVETRDRLGGLYRDAGRLPELFALRAEELALGPDADRRLALRLEMAELLDEIEKQQGRVKVLVANLTEIPGHPESIDLLTRLLGDQPTRLADILADQAAHLEESEGRRASELWHQIARLAETDIGDLDRALNAYRKVAELADHIDAVRAISRIYLDLDQPLEAVPWLERSLARAERDEKSDIAMTLADAHLGAGHKDQAIDALHRSVRSGHAPLPVRQRLAELYRESERWEELGELINETVPLVYDKKAAAELAREAGEIFSERVEAPERALPALERAVELNPKSRDLRLAYARSLRAAGQLADARSTLETLIEEFGRRRSKDRAAAHVELAHVARAEGNPEQAVEQVELASRMDVDNPHMLRMVARMARESGDISRAERSLRALLMIIRRHPPGDDLKAIGTSEVLYELSLLAADNDEREKADDMLDSAFEAAAQSDPEALRLSRTLVELEVIESALQVLRKRVEATGSDRNRAELYGAIADLLESREGRGDEALEARLEAVSLIPEAGPIKAARELARELGSSALLAETLERTANALRGRKDNDTAARVLLVLGDISENDVHDYARAQRAYQQLREIGIGEAEALFALARVFGHLGDRKSQSQALDELTEMAAAGEDRPEKADALYRLAEVQVREPDMVDRGLAMLEQALEIDARYAQAGRTLRTAADVATDQDRVLALWEPVARRAGDPRLLLDYLERTALRPGSTASQIKEAVHAAFSQGEDQRGETLLAEAVARGGGEGAKSANWATLALADHRVARNDLEAARDLLHELAGAGGPAERITGLGLALAERAAASDERRALAAEVYEFLRARTPADPRIWSPLFDVYEAMGSADLLDSLVAETLPQLVEVADRNALRKKRADQLAAAGDHAAAAAILRDALLDDPDDLEATALLERVYRDSDDTAGLADFLWQRFEDARERGNPETVVDLAMRLGTLLDGSDREQARSVFHTALQLAPESRDLLEAVLDHEPAENTFQRADFMERLLAVEAPERAPELTARLVELRDSLEDREGALRALEQGNRVVPDDPGIRDQLESSYRALERYSELAAFLERDAARLEPEQAVDRLREAAALHRDQLGDLDRAIAILDTARARRPADQALSTELATVQRDAGDLAGAVSTLGSALSEHKSGPVRVDLLLERTELLAGLGETAREVADLEEAYALDPERATGRLGEALVKLRDETAAAANHKGERQATMRLAALYRQHGAEEQARDLLLDWVKRSPGDREALVTLREMDTVAERWDGVVTACDQLVRILVGGDQLEAADRLAEAALRLGQPGLAREGLEFVLQSEPTSEPVRAHLRSLYDQTGAYRELAELLLSDADLAESDDVRYGRLRHAADVFVNDLADPQAALDPASKARELRPDDHETVILFADVLIASGQYDDARQMLDPAIAAHRRRSPELAQLQQRMGRLHGAMGDQSGQLAWIKKAFDVDRKSGPIAAELAHLATELGKYDLALKPLRAITLMDNPSPVTRVMALLWEAKIEQARGNLRKAEMWAKKALREDPDFSEAEDFLAQLSG